METWYKSFSSAFLLGIDAGDEALSAEAVEKGLILNLAFLMLVRIN